MKDLFKQFWLANGSKEYNTTWRQIKDERTKTNHSEWLDKITTTNIRSWIVEFRADKELIEQNVKYKKEKQKFQDINRIERKSFREHARVENAIEEYSRALLESLKLNKPVTIEHELNETNSCGVVQLSDLHFNELIDVIGNKYDFSVAAKRLKRLAIKTKKYFKAFGIKNILIAMTGDLMNSNRRLDEILNQATNRANASVLAFFLLKQFIVDLNEDFNIAIADVTGNESRIELEHGYTNIVATDNFDSTIVNFLKIHFMGCDGITFIDGDAKEKVINVSGQNILLLHGEGSLTKGNTQSAIQQKIGAYALKGIIIHYIMYGHLHCANISSHSSRSSSLGGSNTYNEIVLGLVGRAAQNIYIFNDDFTRDGIVVDLQHTNDIKGYDIIKELEAYDAKSASKINNHTTIFQVVI